MDDVPASANERLASKIGEQLFPLLRNNPAGLSEYELFAALYECGDERFDISKLRETFALFCGHFRLFNALYRLRDKLWSRLNGSEKRRQALAVLGLTDPIDAMAIKQHYRRLAMEHHPDRGGDTARLQLINAAMVVLGE